MEKQRYPIENSLYIFLSFAAVGGFLEAYTFLLHGGVFCNAQTGNLVLFVLRLCEGDFSSAVRYVWSLLAYIAGIAASALLPRICRRSAFLIAVTAAEAAVLAALAFQPEGTPDTVTYVSVSFLCALQYNSFTSCRGATLATTFCTNNLRQTVLNLCSGIAEKDNAKLKKSVIYALVILAFAAGAAVGALTAGRLGNYCTLLCTAVLLAVIAVFAAAALRKRTDAAKKTAETAAEAENASAGEIPADAEKNVK